MIFYVGLLVDKTTFLMTYASEILAVVIFLQCVKLWKVSDRLEKLDFSDFQRVPPLNLWLRNSQKNKRKIKRGDPLKIRKIKFFQPKWNFSQLHTLQKYYHSQNFRVIWWIGALGFQDSPTWGQDEQALLRAIFKNFSIKQIFCTLYLHVYCLESFNREGIFWAVRLGLNLN